MLKYCLVKILQEIKQNQGQFLSNESVKYRIFNNYPKFKVIFIQKKVKNTRGIKQAIIIYVSYFGSSFKIL